MHKASSSNSMQMSASQTCFSQFMSMSVCIADLLRYMDKSSNNSGGSSAGSHGTAGGGGIVGSTTAPLAYGIQFMPQPQAIPQHIPPLSQGNRDRALSKCPVMEHCTGVTLKLGAVSVRRRIGTCWALWCVLGIAFVLCL